MLTKLQCGNCGAILKTATPVPEGKRVKCSKCGAVFAASAPDVQPEAAQPPKSVAQVKPRGVTADQVGSFAADSPPAPVKEPDEREAPKDRPRKKRRKKKAASRKWLPALAIVGVVLLLGLGVYAIVHQINARILAKQRRENNERVTMDNFDKLKPGAKLDQAEALLGQATASTADDVADAFRMTAVRTLPDGRVAVMRSAPEQDIQEMIKTFSIHGWYRWQNKTAFIFVGMSKDDAGASQIAVLSFVNNDPDTKSYGAGWKTLPISVEISNTGVRKSVGKPLPQGSLDNFSKIQVGMPEDEVNSLLGLAHSARFVESDSAQASPGRKRDPAKILRYVPANQGALTWPAFGASLVGLAAAPSGSASLSPFLALQTRTLCYEVELHYSQVTGKWMLRVP